MSRYRNIMIVAHNLETGAIGNYFVPATDDPQKVRDAIAEAYGQQIGTIFEVRPDSEHHVPIGTIHEGTSTYPNDERTFLRRSYAFVAPAVMPMDDAKRAAYLKAVLGEDATPAKTEKPAKPAPKAKDKANGKANGKAKAEKPAPVHASVVKPAPKPSPKKRR